MAAAPPPFSPRDAARQARQYARLQRAQLRMQQAQYKAQYGYLRRRPSFVGPALLIAAGVVALLLETGKLDSSAFWPWYARWWPSLLILIGLGLLVEYFFDRHNPQGGRRSLGGAVWLIVLLSLAGAASHATNHLGPWNQQFWDNFGDHPDWLSMLGEQHVETRTLAGPIAPGGVLTIEDARGDVQVSAAEAGAPAEVRVDARQVAHAGSDAAARRDFEATRPQLTAHGADATLTVPGREGASVDLKVIVPAGIALTLRTSHGDVAISGVRRNVDVRESHGQVTLDDLGAAAHVQMDHGDVTAHGIAGDLTIDGKADDVTASQVKGRTLMNGDFFGDTRLDGTGSEVQFHSSRTDLDVPKLGGQLTLDSSGLRLANPSGGLRLTTRSKDIDITGLVGEAHIQDNNGDVTVVAAMPLGNLQVINHTGAISVTLPANASFSVHGSTGDDDEISSEFPLVNAASGDRKTLTGEIGRGGPQIDLSTDHGDLSLHRDGAGHPSENAETPETEKPEKPEQPERPARHLHATGGETPQPTVQ